MYTIEDSLFGWTHILTMPPPSQKVPWRASLTFAKVMGGGGGVGKEDGQSDSYKGNIK